MISAKNILPALLCGLMVACGSPEERADAYLAKAQTLFDDGDYIGAAIEARNAAQIRPKDPSVRVMLAKLAMEKEEWRAALEHLLIAVESDGTLIEPHLMLGSIYFLGRAPERLDKEVAALNELAPDNPEVLLLNAHAAELHGETAAAMDTARRAVAADPANGEAVGFLADLTYRQRGIAAGDAFVQSHIDAITDDAQREKLGQLKIIYMERSGQLDELKDVLIAMSEQYPDNPKYDEALARYYASRGQAEDAERIFRSLIAKDSGELSRQISLVKFLAGEKGPAAAEAALGEFIAASPDSVELRLTLGQLYDADSRLDKAFAEYARAVEMAPESDEAALAQARQISIRMRQGRSDDAQALLEDLLERRPDNEAGLSLRAAVRYSAGDYAGVISDARLIVKKNPQSEAGLLLLAQAHAALDDTLLAKDAYTRLLELNPTHAEGAAGLASMLIEDGKPDEAQVLLENTLAAGNEPDVAVLDTLVAALLAQDETERAEDIAQQLADIDAGTGSGKYQLGQIARAKGRLDEAETFYRQALQANPSLLPALQAIIEMQLAQNNFSDATRELNSYIDTHPDAPGPRLLLARVYAQTGDETSAVQVYRDIIEQYPDVPSAYLGLAQLYEPATAKRRDILERGAAQFETDYRFPIMLAREYVGAGERDKAIDVYTSYLQADPGNHFVVNNLSMLLLAEDQSAERWAQALEYALALADSPNPTELDTLGWAYYRNGDLQAARRVLESAAAGADSVAEIHYHLGMVYAAAGEQAKAERELRRAVEMSDAQPFTGADEARQKLQEFDAS